MQLALFWIFASLMLGFGLLVVLLRNPVSCAMSLVMSFISLAALFMLLDAFFIGIIQVLVYAGAVMVLFLFIIMLLDIKAEKRRNLKVSAWLGGGLVLTCFTYAMVNVVLQFPGSNRTIPALNPEMGSDVALVGFKLFESYNMPFQIIGVLLLVAAVGVVLLSRRELR